MAEELAEPVPLFWNALRASLNVGPSSNSAPPSLAPDRLNELSADPPFDWKCDWLKDWDVWCEVRWLRMGLGLNDVVWERFGDLVCGGSGYLHVTFTARVVVMTPEFSWEES